MKKVILIILISLGASAQQLPSTWYTEIPDVNKANPNLDSLKQYVSNILTVQERVLNKGESTINKGLGDWSLSGQKTDLAISNSGLLGFAALKATTAVELSWSKASQKENNIQTTSSDIILRSSMNEKEILNAVRPAYKVLLKNLPEEEYSWRAKNFEDHVLRYHRAMKGVSFLDNSSYAPTKFRLDMSVSYSSPLFGFTRLSGDTRLRLEWKIVPSVDKAIIKNDQKVVRKILEDVDRALSDIQVKEGYKLDNISIGLGLSRKNLLSFTKVKGSISGHLFLKKIGKKSDYQNQANSETYSWIGEEDNKILGLFKRSKFRKGIKKSFKLTNWFSDQFKGRQSRWVIRKFKTSFSLAYSGFLGLSGTSSSSAVSFTFKK